MRDERASQTTFDTLAPVAIRWFHAGGVGCSVVTLRASPMRVSTRSTGHMLAIAATNSADHE
jgi:hypothetical protein